MLPRGYMKLITVIFLNGKTYRIASACLEARTVYSNYSPVAWRYRLNSTTKVRQWPLLCNPVQASQITCVSGCRPWGWRMWKCTAEIHFRLTANNTDRISRVSKAYSQFQFLPIEICKMCPSLSPHSIPARHLSAPPAPLSLLSGVFSLPSVWYRHHSTCQSPP